MIEKSSIQFSKVAKLIKNLDQGLDKVLWPAKFETLRCRINYLKGFIESALQSETSEIIENTFNPKIPNKIRKKLNGDWRKQRRNHKYECDDCKFNFKSKTTLLDTVCPNCKGIHVKRATNKPRTI